MTDTILISMPFGPVNTPSLGLSLLRQGLLKEGMRSKIKYYNVEFLKRIDITEYIRISNGFPTNHDLLGEFLFSCYLFNKDEKELESYFNEVYLGENPSHNKESYRKENIKQEYLKTLREIVSSIPGFIAYCLEDVLKERPKIVGFTSIFQQHLASLCLAKEIKLRSPETIIVFGGANVESVMGLENIKQFEFIDYVVSGEGDKAFPELVKNILNDNKNVLMPGVFNKESIIHTPARLSTDTINNLDEVSIPDYDDFFSVINTVDYSKHFKLRLLFETSRGCWWGERHHCTFCGLNGQTMKHRSKSYRRVLTELEMFQQKYSGFAISVVDNILDMGYFKDLIPELKRNNKRYELFYEVKANLKKEQIIALSEVGITMIQPGIESLSSAVLKEMNKGVSALQNIQLLKWSKESGVLPIWNLLWGFPHEKPEEYEKMSSIVEKLFHLAPPSGYATIRIDRFSPNHSDYRKMGYEKIFPYPSYNFVFSTISQSAIENLAYYFDYSSHNKSSVPFYTRDLAMNVKVWNDLFKESELFYVPVDNVMLVCDTRANKETEIYILPPLCGEIIRNTDRATSIKELSLYLQTNLKVDAFEINSAIEFLDHKQLIIEEEGKILSLLIELNERYKPNVGSLKKLKKWLEQNATMDSENNFILKHGRPGLTPQPSLLN